MNMRPAKVDDAPALARVHVDAWRAAYAELVPGASLERFDYRSREEAFRGSLATGAEETYVVQLNQEIVGFLTLGAARDPDLDTQRTGEIWGIYVAPAYWRRGIGRRLAQEGERILQSRGHEGVVLWALRDNQQARRFYEALGFRPDGASRALDWGARLTAVRYRKALPPVGQAES